MDERKREATTKERTVFFPPPPPIPDCFDTFASLSASVPDDVPSHRQHPVSEAEDPFDNFLLPSPTDQNSPSPVLLPPPTPLLLFEKELATLGARYKVGARCSNRGAIERSMHNLPCETAKKVYSDVVRIHDPSPHPSEVPFLSRFFDVTDDSVRERILTDLVRMGSFMDHLSDAMQMEPEMREVVWRAEREAMDEAAARAAVEAAERDETRRRQESFSPTIEKEGMQEKQIYDDETKTASSLVEDATPANPADIYAEHQKEIQRRRNVTPKDGSGFGGEEEDEDCSFPFKNDQQVFFVYSLSQGRPETKGFSPYPADLSNPGLCLYGAFPSVEEARDHAIDVSNLQKGSVMIGTTHEWMVGIRDETRVGKEGEAVSFLLSQEEERRSEAKRDFERSLDKKEASRLQNSGGEDGDEDEKERPSKPDSTQPNPPSAPLPEGKARARRAKAGTEVRGQKIAVVTVLPDRRYIGDREDSSLPPSPEFLFRVYAFFEDEKEANSYVKNVCGEEVVDYDIDTVLACEWIFPQSMVGDKAKTDVYRDDELNKIMKYKKNQPKEIERYKRWRDQKMAEAKAATPTEEE